MHLHAVIHFFFFFNDTATTEIYTLSLHDALPIYFHFNRILTRGQRFAVRCSERDSRDADAVDVQHHQQGVAGAWAREPRSEEHTSELQSLAYLVCRLLLEKKTLMSHANVLSV